MTSIQLVSKEHIMKDIDETFKKILEYTEIQAKHPDTQKKLDILSKVMKQARTMCIDLIEVDPGFGSYLLLWAVTCIYTPDLVWPIQDIIDGFATAYKEKERKERCNATMQ